MSLILTGCQSTNAPEKWGVQAFEWEGEGFAEGARSNEEWKGYIFLECLHTHLIYMEIYVHIMFFYKILIDWLKWKELLLVSGAEEPMVILCIVHWQGKDCMNIQTTGPHSLSLYMII